MICKFFVVPGVGEDTTLRTCCGHMNDKNA